MKIGLRNFIFVESAKNFAVRLILTLSKLYDAKFVLIHIISTLEIMSTRLAALLFCSFHKDLYFIYYTFLFANGSN